MITIEIGQNGRLGNQMFQYASLMGIAKKQNLDYAIDYSKGNDIPWNQFTDDELINKNCLTIDKPFNLSVKNLPVDFKYDQLLSEGEQNFHFQEKFFNTGDNIKLHGYFQTPKYFSHCVDEIRKEYTFKPDIVDAATNLLKEKQNYETVSVHFRRGDYVHLSHHGICSLDYYSRAFNEFSDKSYYFVIITDDIQWAKQTCSGASNFFISESKNQFIDLCLMSLCNHNIIANSSFSWWGSWLNKNKNKRVVAPARWFGGHLSSLNTKDLYQPNWIVI